jgi:hypothetical protein
LVRLFRLVSGGFMVAQVLAWIHPDKFWIELLSLALAMETLAIAAYFLERFISKRK